jgi:hypothetical protein
MELGRGKGKGMVGPGHLAQGRMLAAKRYSFLSRGGSVSGVLSAYDSGFCHWKIVMLK